MNQIPTQVSESVRKRNPHIYGPIDPHQNADAESYESIALSMPDMPKRVRQDKPLNDGEREFGEILKRRFDHPKCEVRPQGIRLAIASGAWWTPDWTVLDPIWISGCCDRQTQRITFFEVKGPKKARWSRGGELTIKVAARAWPMFRFVLAWKDKGGAWGEQEIEP